MLMTLVFNVIIVANSPMLRTHQEKEGFWDKVRILLTCCSEIDCEYYRVQDVDFVVAV